MLGKRPLSSPSHNWGFKRIYTGTGKKNSNSFCQQELRNSKKSKN